LEANAPPQQLLILTTIDSPAPREFDWRSTVS